MPNLLFDYDGTLHDSMKIYAPSVQLAWDNLAAKGLTEPRTLSEEELRPCIGMTPDEMWGYFAMNIGEEEKRECTKLVGDNMLELVRRGEAKLYDGVPEALAELRRRGFHLVLLSNCPVSYLEAHTEQFHLEQYFEGLYCAEEFGYRPKYEIFERLRGHYPGPFAVVGDRRHDMEAAQRGGVPAIGCLYGYGSREELAPAAYLAYAAGIVEADYLVALFFEVARGLRLALAAYELFPVHQCIFLKNEGRCTGLAPSSRMAA